MPPFANKHEAVLGLLFSYGSNGFVHWYQPAIGMLPCECWLREGIALSQHKLPAYGPNAIASNNRVRFCGSAVGKFEYSFASILIP